MVTAVILLAMFIVSAITTSGLTTKWYMIPLRALVGLVLTTVLVIHRGDDGPQLITSLLMMLGAFLVGTLVGLVVNPPKQAPNGGRNNH